MRFFQAIGSWLWPWRWMGVGVVVAWGWVMFRLASGPSTVGAKELEELYPWAVHKTIQVGSEWAGIYMAGKKMGYSHTRTEKQSGGFQIVNRSVMKMKIFGSYQEVKILSRVQTDQRYRLRQFVFKLLSPLSKFQAEGKVIRDKLSVHWHVGTRKVRMSLPYRPSMLPTVLRPYIAAQKPPPGKKIKAVLFDPQSRSYIDTFITVEKYVSIVIRGKRVKALQLRQQYRGVTLLAWIDKDGKILKEQAPGGMVLIRESAREAPKGIDAGFDIIRATRIGLVGKLKSPTRQARLRVRIERVSLSSFPALRMGRQAVHHNVLTVTKENLSIWPKTPFVLGSQSSVSKLPRARPAQKKRSRAEVRRARMFQFRRAEALKPTLLVQSKHPTIVAQARAIVKRSKDRLHAILQIARWVNKALRKRSVVGIPSALDTLAKRVGDCNEHATLLAALARSVAIPCEIVTGVAYQGGRFYFHAWNECEAAPEKWVSLDATWNQFPSDVTHLVFARGGLEKQLALLQLLNRLRLVVVNEPE